jgi:predicted nucleic acid-binding protein
LSAYFFDSSAIVKRYAAETGSRWVAGLTDPASGHDILIAEIALVEVAAALSWKARPPGGLSIATRDQAISLFHQDCRDRFTLIPVNRRLFDLAVDLVQRQPLRAYDAVQLAAAILADAELLSRGLGAVTFVSADHALLAAAASERLATQDPNAHP